jgi:hypothetical protein
LYFYSPFLNKVTDFKWFKNIDSLSLESSISKRLKTCRMKKLLSFVILFYCLHLNAQTYQKTYGGASSDVATDIAATKDGGNIAVGDTYSFGVLNSDMFFVKTDAAGNVQWSKTLGTADYDHASAVIQTTDGGYAIAGSSGGNNNRMALVKLDADGNRQWVRYYAANSRQSGSTLVQTPDGGYAVAGQVSTYNNGSWGYLVRTDSTGNLLWSKLIFSKSFYPEILDMTLTSDGGFALAGIFADPAYYDMYLIKLNSAGNFEWARSVGGSSTELPAFVKQTRDGGYLMGGMAFSYGSILGQDMFVVKTTSNGTLQWAKNIGTAKSENFNDAFEIPGGYVIVGSTDSASNFIRRPMLVRLRTDGQFQGARILLETDNIGVGSVTEYSSNGFSIAGSLTSSITGTQEMYIAKFDRLGNICGGFTSFGDVKDTGAMVVQNIPVTNANTGVIIGAENTITRTVTTGTVCSSPVASSVAATDHSSALQIQKDARLRISPNPASSILQMQWTSENSTLITVSIFSAEGKQMLNHKHQAVKGENLLTLPVSNLKSGMYMLRMISSNKQETIKFIKE